MEGRAGGDDGPNGKTILNYALEGLKTRNNLAVIKEIIQNGQRLLTVDRPKGSELPPFSWIDLFYWNRTKRNLSSDLKDPENPPEILIPTLLSIFDPAVSYYY